jgi:hypothetical protein
MQKFLQSKTGRAVLRFGRTAVAIGAGAALTWAGNHGADLGLDAYWTAAFGSAIAALGKLLRDAGALPADWSPI